MAECHGTVMREITLNQHMTVETFHLRNCEYANASKGMCCHRKNLSVCHIGSQFVVCGALQTEKRNITRNNIAFKGSLGYLFRKASCHNELILHLTEGKLFRGGIAAVEAHKYIMALVVKFILDLAIVKIVRHGIVDVQKCHGILAHAGSNELT